MAEEADEGMECFDEELLFSEFDAVSNQNPTDYSSCKHEQEQNSTSADLKALKEENYQLKHVLKKLLGEKKDSLEKPFFNAIFYNNTISTEGRQKLEFFLHSLLKAQQDSFSGLDPPSENSAIYSNLQPSLIPLNQLKDNTESERSNEETPDELQSHHFFSVINCSQYFDAYCVDSCGFPLDNCDPINSEGWNIPIYEQVFFTALPCDEENSKIRVRRGKACFNCGCIGHNVSDCPEPQNLARVEAKRKEFMNKFSSPFAKFSRYHFDEKRFGAFKPGVIGDKLREALGIGDNEVPPYIYKMRMLGYPPGYIPSVNSSTLVLYDADGNVDNYVMENLDEDDEDDENTRENLFVKYPGFNCSLPHGVKDKSAQMGFPQMGRHQQISEMERYYKQMHAQSVNTARKTKKSVKKRKWTESNRGAGDMEIDEEEEHQVPVNHDSVTANKRRKYDDGHIKEDEGSYSPSHPGIQCGTKEQELLQQLHDSSTSKRQSPPGDKAGSVNEPHQPCELSKVVDADDGDSKSLKRKDRKQRNVSTESMEDGEIVSDEDGECEEKEECEGKDGKSNQGWWLTVPLMPSLKACKTLTPPPVPAVKLPMDLLTRFYTSSTSLQSVSFEDRIMWLDPIYGNIQVSTGRYDKLKEILQKKIKRGIKK